MPERPSMRPALRILLSTLCLALAPATHAEPAPAATTLRLIVTSADGTLVNAMAQELAAQHYAITLAVTTTQAQPDGGGHPQVTSQSVTATRTGKFSAEQVRAAAAQCADYARRGQVRCTSEASLSFP